MEVEDVIELGSSDEDPGPPPPKKVKTLTNAMVHIPTKIHGVTIKPVKVLSANTTKLFPGRNITVTKITNAQVQAHKGKQIKPLDKLVNKAIGKVGKKKVMRKLNVGQSKGTVFNPLSQVKKIVPHSVENSVIKLKNPIQILGPQALQKLPPGVTVKKTVAPTKPPASVINHAKSINIIKKKKMELQPQLPTVELDDEETPVSSDSPQWYMRPEEQNKTTPQEETNNKEPQTPNYIEITIEDSPIKPTKTKRTRELSTENVITIIDSPNKDETVNADADEGSDTAEPNTSKNAPKSKKKLKYKHDNLTMIKETQVLEIEIDPIAIDDSTSSTGLNSPVRTKEKSVNNSEIVTLTPDIVKVQESSVEIAQNQQGDVSVQVKPTHSQDKPSNTEISMTQNEFDPTYLSFINICLQLENSDDMKKIVEKKIKTYHRQVPKEYTQSEEFIDMVSSKVQSIKAAPEKMYLYIKDIVDELNLQRKLAKQMPVQEIEPKDDETFSFSKDSKFDPNKQRQIRKLEKTLKKLNRAIQKLEMQEVDFEDEEDSVYLLTEKYKERMVRVHAKFCQLTNSKMPSEPRLVIDPRPGQPPGPAKRLEAWINKKNDVTFPDFHDVLRCVREANNEDKIGWNEAFVIEEARDLFVRCGRKLQRRRQEKEWRLATSRVTITEDPAEQSAELKKRLEDNRHLANTKEVELFDKFSDRQNQLKLEAEEIDDKDAEESPVESEEEDNDESSSLESKQRRKERIRRLLQEQSKKNSIPKPQATEEDIESTDTKAEPKLKQQPLDDDNTIQSLSDDSNEISSDIDELHLLQKLHSDNEVREVSSEESSDSDTPIAISDTLSSDDNSDGSKKQQPCDIISIENSSYSDDSDSQQQNNARRNIVNTLCDKEIECSSLSIVKLQFTDEPLADPLLTSSDAESNVSVLVSSENKHAEEKVFGQRSMIKTKKTLSTHFEISGMSESAELCTNFNNFEKRSDADGEESVNSSGTNNNACSSSDEHNIVPGDRESETLITLELENSTSTTSNKEDISGPQSPNVVEKMEDETKEEKMECTSEKSTDFEVNADSSNSQSVIIIEQLDDPPKHSDGSQMVEVGLNLKDALPVTLNEVSLDVSPLADSEEPSPISLKEASTTKPMPISLDEIKLSFVKPVEEKITDAMRATELMDNVVEENVSQGGDACTETKDRQNCSPEQVTENPCEIMITSMMSMTKETLQENLNSRPSLESLSDCGTEMISNENSNSNLDIPDLLQIDTNLTENNAVDDKEESNSNERLAVDKGAIVTVDPISKQSIGNVKKILDDMFKSVITAVEAPRTLSPT